MKGITWARDSHGLFDYETRHPLKKQMRTETSQQLVRTAKNNELHILSNDQDYKEAF
jgi:predicted nuclease of predicted toxin-antitoxin system